MICEVEYKKEFLEIIIGRLPNYTILVVSLVEAGERLAQHSYVLAIRIITKSVY